MREGVGVRTNGIGEEYPLSDNWERWGAATMSIQTHRHVYVGVDAFPGLDGVREREM